MTSNVGAELIERNGEGLAIAGHGSYEAMRDKIWGKATCRTLTRLLFPRVGYFGNSTNRLIGTLDRAVISSWTRNRMPKLGQSFLCSSSSSSSGMRPDVYDLSIKVSPSRTRTKSSGNSYFLRIYRYYTSIYAF